MTNKNNVKKYIIFLIIINSFISCKYDNDDLIQIIKNNEYNKISNYLIKSSSKDNFYINDELLLLAYNLDNKKIFNLLLEYNANPNINNENDQPLLKVSYEENKIDYFEKLLENGANSFVFHRVGNNYDPLLFTFIKNKKYKYIDRLLIDFDFSYRDKDKNSLLHIIANSNFDKEVLLRIISNFDDVNIVNEREETPFFFACRASNFDYMDILLDYGADLRKNAKYFYPWGNAISKVELYNNYDLVDYLIEKGPPLDEITTHVGGSILSHACEILNFELVKYLLDKGATPYLKDEHGRIALSSLGGPISVTKDQYEKYKQLFDLYK